MNSTITRLKAIGIMLMVLGHLGDVAPFVHQFIYMFHMPLFFFLSGYCFKKQYLSAPMTYLHKRLKRLYLPYIEFGIIFLIFHNIFFQLCLYNSECGYSWHGDHLYNRNEYLQYFFEILIMKNTEQLLGGYWFLHALLFGSVISWLCLKFVKKPIFGICLSLLVGIVCNKFNISLFGNYISSREFTVAFFFLVGNYISQHKVKCFSYSLIITGLLFVFWGSTLWYNDLSIGNCSNKIYIPYCIIAVLAIWSIYSLCNKWKEQNSTLSELTRYIGNHTLDILTWHFLCFKIVSFIVIRIYNLPIKRLAEFPTINEYTVRGWWIIYLLIGIFVPLVIPYTKEKIIAYAKC